MTDPFSVFDVPHAENRPDLTGGPSTELAATLNRASGETQVPRSVFGPVHLLRDTKPFEGVTEVRNSPAPQIPEALLTARALTADPDSRGYFGRNKVHLRAIASDLAKCFGGRVRRGPDGLWTYREGVWEPAGEMASFVLRELLKDGWTQALEDRVLAFMMRDYDYREITNHPATDGWTSVVNFRNGLFSTSSAELTPHDPDVLSTWQLMVPYLPGPAPLFTAFLEQVLPADMLEPDSNGVAPWQEDLGYLLLPGNPMHVAFLLRGGGRNGKGVYMSVVHAISGRTSGVSLEDIASPDRSRFRTYDLYGSPLNICGEIDPKYMRDTAAFKALTGDDPMQFERKFGKPFTARSWSTLVFSANKDFRASDNSVAFWDRWQVRSFPHYIPDHRRDPALAARIYREEGPQIAAKAMAGLRNLMARGRFVETPSSAEVKQRFRLHSDHVGRFIDERCRFSGEDNDRTTRAQLLAAYKQWCEDEQERYPVRATELYDAVRNAANLAGVPEKRLEPKTQGIRGFAFLSLEDQS